VVPPPEKVVRLLLCELCQQTKRDVRPLAEKLSEEELMRHGASPEAAQTILVCDDCVRRLR
jgi:hypothetical protein